MTWGTAYKTKLKRIQTKKNQFVPCVFFAHKRENAKIYYALLEILKLDDTFKMKIALFAHKIKKDKKKYSSFFFSGPLTPASEFRYHNTRYAPSQNFYTLIK